MENSGLNIGLRITDLVVGNCYRVSLRGVSMNGNASNGEMTPAPGPALTFIAKCTGVDVDEDMATFRNASGLEQSVSLSLYKVEMINGGDCAGIQGGGSRNCRRHTRRGRKNHRKTRRHQRRRS